MSTKPSAVDILQVKENAKKYNLGELLDESAVYPKINNRWKQVRSRRQYRRILWIGLKSTYKDTVLVQAIAPHVKKRQAIHFMCAVVDHLKTEHKELIKYIDTSKRKPKRKRKNIIDLTERAEAAKNFRQIEKLIPKIDITRDLYTEPKKIIRDSDEFYKSFEWRYLRAFTIALHGNKCLKCGIKPERGKLHIDHIFPRSRYPELALKLTNTQPLCEECNVEKHTDVVDHRSMESRQKALDVTYKEEKEYKTIDDALEAAYEESLQALRAMGELF